MSIKMVVIVPPWGFDDPLDVYFVGEDEELNLYGLTRGEGQVLVFTLTEFDCSTNFKAAIDDGRLLKDLEGEFRHKLHLEMS